ncbi:MAG TPA: hypothetical protein VGK00_07565 [Anaerolineales bacterium]|jgi:hypothetical protein
MTLYNQSALALKAYREVRIEMGMQPAPGQTLFPGLADSLDTLANLPADALLFGIASDGLPLLLHLSDPRPGPILVTGEQGSGKTAFLKVLLLAAQRLSTPAGARFAVLTNYPAEFDDLLGTAGLLGAWPTCGSAAAELIYQLADRAHDPLVDQPILALIDGLDSLLQMDSQTQDNLAYLLTGGPRGLVWPVVTLNSELALSLPHWLEFFRTRIYGRIANPHTAAALTPIPAAPLNGLFPGSQFCLRHRSAWLKFWLPNLPA